MIFMLVLYFAIFILIGVFLNLLRGYDLFTISVVYVIASFFLYFIDIYAVGYVILFFAIAEGITSLLNKKHGKRNYTNILGNCFASVILFLVGLGFTTIGMFNSTVFAIAALASISAAFSDTLSSEIGRLSKYRPVLITNFKKVKKGTDGAISVLGISAAIIGSGITFLFFWIIKYELRIALIIAVCGVIGSLLDSLIGATLENGINFKNNHTNFLATLLTGVIAILLFIFI